MYQATLRIYPRLPAKNMMKTITLITISLFILGFSNLQAAIVYTNINNVTLPIGGAIDIDFNADGIIDFTISDQGFGGVVEPGVFFNTANHSFVTVSAAEWDVLTGLPINTTINATSGWFAAGDAYIDPFWGTTAFPIVDTYIGAQFEINGNIHYGWILVNWDANGTFIIRSYAYESDVNTAINTGAMATNTTTLITSITLQGQGNSSTINTGDDLQIQASILPLNANDPSVTWTVINGTGSATIDVNGLLTGLTIGTVTVIATANDGSGITGQITITITEDTVDITSPTVTPPLVTPNPIQEEEEEEAYAFIYVPNVFTPNSGSYNNSFRVITENIAEFEIIFFNRWGEIVYVSYDHTISWDGVYNKKTSINNDMFVWQINYIDLQGAKKQKYGQILILQ